MSVFVLLYQHIFNIFIGHFIYIYILYICILYVYIIYGQLRQYLYFCASQPASSGVCVSDGENAQETLLPRMLTYADVCRRMLTYAAVS